MKKCCRTKPQRSCGAWQKEREAILQRLCQRIEDQVSQGKKVRPLIWRAARRWNGKPFRCDPSRTLALSPGGFNKLFYNWRRNGRTAQSFALKFNPANRRPVTPQQVTRFVRHASQPGTFTFAAAFAAMQRTSQPVQYSPTHFFSSLPAELSKALRRLFHGRRQQRGIETRFKHFLAKGGYYA